MLVSGVALAVCCSDTASGEDPTVTPPTPYTDLVYNPSLTVMSNHGPLGPLVYDGTAKTSAIALKTAYSGAGAITIHYSLDNINAGEVTVTIDVAEGDSYKAASGLEIGTFEITSTQKSDNTMLYIVIAALVVIGVVFVAYIMTNSRRRRAPANKL